MAVTAPVKTRAERLDDLIRKVAPKTAAFHKTHRRWPLKESPEGDESRFATPDASVQKLIRRFKADPDRREKHDDIVRMDAESTDQFRRQAPYEIKTADNGSIVILLTSEDGDVTAGRGATIEDALTALEAKLS